MLAVVLRTEKSRCLAEDEICAGQLPILRLELEDPLPVADLPAGGLGRRVRVATNGPCRAGRGRLSPPHPPPQRLGMDVELTSDPSDRSAARTRITPGIHRQPRRALFELIGVLPWCTA